MRERWAVALAVLLLFTGCASRGSPGASPTPSPSAPALAGTSWVVTHIKGSPTIAAKQPTMTFADGRVGGNASCNQYGAEFKQSGSTLTIGLAAQTQMACADDAVMKQEGAFNTALGEVKAVRGNGDGVELLTAAGAVALTLAKAPDTPDKPLVGTAWTLSGIVSGDTAVSPVAGTSVTMTFTETAVSGRACNTFRGPVTVKDATIEVGPLASTKMACTNEAEGKQETSVLAILDAATGYSIEGDTLTLTAPDSKGLTFTAA